MNLPGWLLLAGALAQSACHTTAAENAEVSVSRAEWSKFVTDIGSSLSRKVPQTTAGRLESFAYYCTRDAETSRCPASTPGGRLGFESGDRVVAVNQSQLPTVPGELDRFLENEMNRAAASYWLSFTIQRDGKTRTLSARCD